VLSQSRRPRVGFREPARDGLAGQVAVDSPEVIWVELPKCRLPRRGDACRRGATQKGGPPA
jgi:hypothetical protein